MGLKYSYNETGSIFIRMRNVIDWQFYEVIGRQMRDICYHSQ